MQPPTRIERTAEWRALAEHHQRVKDVHLRELFAADPGRGEAMTAEAGDLYLDFAKQRLTGETLRLLLAVADRVGLRERIDAMVGRGRINPTQGPAVLHL